MKVKLQHYSNDECSGVQSFALLPGGMIVQFQEGGAYLYDRKHPGPKHLDAMIALARAGKGLSTYISRYVRDNYADRFTADELSRLQHARISL